MTLRALCPPPAAAFNAPGLSRTLFLSCLEKLRPREWCTRGAGPCPMQAWGSQLAEDTTHPGQASKDAWVKKGRRLRFPQKSRLSLRPGDQISPGALILSRRERPAQAPG